MKQRCRDGVMNDSLFWCQHPHPSDFASISYLLPGLSATWELWHSCDITPEGRRPDGFIRQQLPCGHEGSPCRQQLILAILRGVDVGSPGND